MAALWCLAAAASATAADASTNALATIEVQARAGDPAAQFRLGTLYYMGLGTVQDWGVAVQWLGKAARQGDAEAQCELGMIYQIGADGVVRDLAQAVDWYRKSASQDDSAANFALAALYADGQGMAQDAAMAQTLRGRITDPQFTANSPPFPLNRLYRHFLSVATALFPLPDESQIP